MKDKYNKSIEEINNLLYIIEELPKNNKESILQEIETIEQLRKRKIIPVKRINNLLTYLKNTIRNKDKDKKGKKCEKCAKTTNLHIHHNSYLKNRTVLTLCDKCHYKLHNKP